MTAPRDPRQLAIDTEARNEHRKHRRRPSLDAIPWTGLSLVLAVAGLLGALALPGSDALERKIALEHLEGDLVSGLQDLRRAVRAYRSDHGAWPGADPSHRAGETQELHLASWLARQLLMRSDAAGRCTHADLPSHPFGPYLEGGLPANPVNGLNSVRMLRAREEMPDEPDGLSGWMYDPLKGEVRANCEGELQSSGTRFFDL